MFFFIIPVGVDYRARRYPVITFTLMGLCVLIYLVTLILRLSMGPEVTIWVFRNLWLIPAESHWWTYLTAVFVHGGFFHLLGNMIYLFLFGSCVEDIIGRTRFTLFYLLCGVGANLVYIAATPEHFESGIPLGGASGAISACIGGFVLLLARTEIEFKWIFFFMFRVWNREFHIPAWVVISFWFGEDLVMAALSAISDHSGGGVAFAAHVGGSVLGLAWVSLEKVRLKREAATEEVEDLVARVKVRKRVHVAAPSVAETPSIHLFFNNEQTGPFTLSHVQQMLALGSVPPDALYWQEGMADWFSVNELRDPAAG